MVAALKTWRQTWLHLSHRGALYIWANVLWAVLSLPLITAPAAWAALNYLSYQALRESTVTLEDFWSAFRSCFWRALVLGLANVLVLVVNLSNLLVYRDVTGVEIFRAVWVLALVGWFGIQFFIWPLYFAMKHPTLLGAFRNAVVLVLQHPFYAAVSWIIISLVLLLSVVLPLSWLLITASLLAVAANCLVADRLRLAGFAADVRSVQALPAEGGIYRDIYG